VSVKIGLVRQEGIRTVARCTQAVVSNLVKELLDSVSEVEGLSRGGLNTRLIRVGQLGSLDVIVSVGGIPRIRGMECYSMHSLVCILVTEVGGMPFAASFPLGK
jgi:hypothetical protein